MQYIVFDLEFNQDFSDKELTTYPFEIIQIGAVKLNKDLIFLTEFNRYIKPSIYKNINPYIANLTGISIEKLMNEETFQQVYQDFIEFLGKDDTVFCVWGISDMKELFKNAKFFNLHEKLLPRMYINLQPYVSMYVGLSPKKLLQLKKAVKLLGISENLNYHDAINDAYYTAELLKKIYNKTIEPKIYNPNYIKPKNRQKREEIDFDRLINQFEKMYCRSMNEEEQQIIKLAYKMGRTRQFIK